MPIEWYYPSGASGPIACAWLTDLRDGEGYRIIIYTIHSQGRG